MKLSAIESLWPQHLLQIVPALEELGYHRFWTTEHHGTGFQSASPMIACTIAGHLSEKLRVGTAAVLLPFYSPMKVVEDARMLELFFPGRIDIGVASGGTAEPAQAYLARGGAGQGFETMVREFVGLERGSLRDVAGITPQSVGPYTGRGSGLWICGMSVSSARLAADLGMGFAYHHSLSGGRDGSSLTREYVRRFTPHARMQKPAFNVTCYGLCAKTDGAAEARFGSLQREVLFGKEPDSFYAASPKYVVGSAAKCATELRRVRDLYDTDELVLQSFAQDVGARIESYELLKRALA